MLDSCLLGNVAINPAIKGAVQTHSEQCYQWLMDCEAASKVMLVPAIAYYEEVRDLYQRQAVAKLARFQAYCFHPKRFIEIDHTHFTEAAKLWGDLRRAGLPTSDRLALDGDAILAAQVLSLNLPAGEFVVATRNPNHISRFGLPVEQWENITP